MAGCSWVAEHNGYSADEGLEYDFVAAGDYGIHSARRDDAGQIKSGAFETFEDGRDGANVSCACHWPRAPPPAAGRDDW